MKNYIVNILVFLFFSVACSPMLSNPEVVVPDRYIYGDGFLQDSCGSGVAWWNNFGDSTLNKLIVTSLENNKNLAATLSNIESARHNLTVARAEFLPSLSFDATGEKYRISGETTQEYTIEPTIDWEVSLFGAFRNTKKRALTKFFSQEWAYRGVELSLTTQVATTYFTLMQYERSYNIACESCRLRQEATALVDSMYRYGMSDGVALFQAQSLVYAAQADVYKYQRAMEQAQLSLDLLLGIPSKKVDNRYVGMVLANDILPVFIPIGLPSDLLERRPDVMESYYNMQSAAAEVGISRAERFPSISLTGGGGLASTSLKGLTSKEPWGWSVTADFVAPIFNFGKYRARERMAKEEYKTSVKMYEQSVLEALADVETSLIQISTYRHEANASASLVMANSKIAYTTKALYRSGMGDYLSVIDAERELYSSQISFIEIVAQQYINYIDLFKALGGGW